LRMSAWFNPEPLYPRPIVPGYKEFSGYESFVPGRHKIRAVYGNELSARLAAAGIKKQPEDVKVETPFIEFTVVP